MTSIIIAASMSWAGRWLQLAAGLLNTAAVSGKLLSYIQGCRSQAAVAHLLLFGEQGDVQRLAKRVAAAEEAAAAAAAASAEAQQAAAAAEGELASFKAARARVESELRQQLVELRQERDAEVAALVQKLERALATCDK